MRDSSGRIIARSILPTEEAALLEFSAGMRIDLTPREPSSGERRRLGRITKHGDPYLRTLLIHGARSALLAAERAHRAGRSLTHHQAWALERAGEGHTNRAAVALANKLARIAWAVWRHERNFDGDHALQLAAA